MAKPQRPPQTRPMYYNWAPPNKYETADHFIIAGMKYLDDCEANKRFPNQAGLALSLGMTLRCLHNYGHAASHARYHEAYSLIMARMQDEHWQLYALGGKEGPAKAAEFALGAVHRLSAVKAMEVRHLEDGGQNKMIQAAAMASREVVDTTSKSIPAMVEIGSKEDDRDRTFVKEVVETQDEVINERIQSIEAL